jgi:REP element-mobilizing transposase RayT
MVTAVSTAFTLFRMRHRIYVPVVWTTRFRRQLIDATIADILCPLIRNVAEQEKALVLGIGLVQTHVHLLVRLHPTTAVPRLLQRIKGGSALLITRQLALPERRALRWSKGYSMESVNVRSIESVLEYLRNQPTHHPQESIVGEVQ